MQNKRRQLDDVRVVGREAANEVTEMGRQINQWGEGGGSIQRGGERKERCGGK